MSKTQPELYSMRVVARLTGLNPDTIRKWEQRYRAIAPQRTAGNTRKFTGPQIRRLSLLRLLTADGHSIQDVAGLADEQLEALAAHPADPVRPSGDQTEVASGTWTQQLVQDYLDHIRHYRVHQASDLLSRAALSLPTGRLIHELVLPSLRQTGELWEHGQASVAQEHLISAQLRSTLLNLLHWHTSPPGASRMVVATPAGQLHEFGSLIGAITAAGRGFDPIYLGANLPADDILEAARRLKAQLVLLSVVCDLPQDDLDSLAEDLRRTAAGVETWLGLPKGHRIAARKTGARLFHSFEELEMALTQRNSKART